MRSYEDTVRYRQFLSSELLAVQDENEIAKLKSAIDVLTWVLNEPFRPGDVVTIRRIYPVKEIDKKYIGSDQVWGFMKPGMKFVVEAYRYEPVFSTGFIKLVGDFNWHVETLFVRVAVEPQVLERDQTST